MSERMSVRLVPVPPPRMVPIDANAEDLLLVPGLRAEPRQRQFRCACCSKMQPTSSWLVWVPDGVKRSDPAWSVTEACRLSAFNGSGSGWCLKCAQKFSRPALAAALRFERKVMTPDRFLTRYFSRAIIPLGVVAVIGWWLGIWP